MKIFYPKDKDGNSILFKTSENNIYGSNGVKLTDQLASLEQRVSELEGPFDVADKIDYDPVTERLNLYVGNNIISSVEITSLGNSIPSFAPNTVSDASATVGEESLEIKWTDPNDTVVDGLTIARWSGTRLVIKANSIPNSVTDGTYVDVTTRNQYTTNGKVFDNLTNGTTYYVRFYTYTLGENSERLYNETEVYVSGVPKASTRIYGICINSGDSNPSTAVTYLEDAVGKTPAHMNYSSGNFEYGSWSTDEFFMPRPCMLKYDGTVDYYLDPTDYTKKENGTTSDIANTSYSGNAMMEWGRDGKQIWYKFVNGTGNDSGKVFIYFANSQVDNAYKAWSFYDCNNTLKEHFYTPIYNGSNVSSRLRSLSGQSCCVNTTVSTEWQYARSNNSAGSLSGDRWFTETYSDRILINYLLVLMSKSLDTQTSFGYGYASSSNSAKINTGTLNTRGLFWGENAGTSGVKVFGMENYWGNIFRRIAGWVTSGYTQKFKMTHGTVDGTSVSSYNTDGSGYISQTGSTLSSGNGGYPKKYIYNESKGIVELDKDNLTNGSQTTYYCDYSSWYSGCFAYVGGYWDDGLNAGAFCFRLNSTASYSDSIIGASLSFR